MNGYVTDLSHFGGKLTGYWLLDETGRTSAVDIQTIKQAMKAGQIEVLGLKLTQDDKLIKDEYALKIIRPTIKYMRNKMERELITS